MAPELPSSRVPRAWHWQTPGQPSAHPISRRRRKIFAVLAAMALLLGMIIAWFFFMSSFQEPVFFAIACDEYDKSLPVTAFGRRDSEALFQFFPKHDSAYDNQELDQLREKLNKLDKPFQSKEKTL